MPGISCVPFGHLGDGNIHVNLVQPEGADPAAFLARDHELMDAVNEVVRDLDGSFSAEHGIGRLKPYMMPEWRGGAELDLMRRIKAGARPAGHAQSGQAAALTTAARRPPGNGMIGTVAAGGQGRGVRRADDEAIGRRQRAHHRAVLHLEWHRFEHAVGGA